MRANFSATNPKGIEFTLTITMSLEHWEIIRCDLGGNGLVSLQFRNQIKEMIDQANIVFSAGE